MSLPFARVDSTALPLPPRAPNGGLYTGAPFRAGAPWANVPMEPDAHARAAALVATPAGREHHGPLHVPLDVRPGNNEPAARPFYTELAPATHPGLGCLT